MLYTNVGNKYKLKYILFAYMKISRNIFNRKSKNNYRTIHYKILCIYLSSEKETVSFHALRNNFPVLQYLLPFMIFFIKSR